MSGIFGHVTELSSKIEETITIEAMLIINGKSVHATQAPPFKSLRGGGLINIDAHKLQEFLLSEPKSELQLHVFVHKKLNHIYHKKLELILPLIYLLECVRITFKYNYNGGDVSLTATGLKGQEGDKWLRIRCLGLKRRKELNKREKNTELVLVNIGNPVIGGSETNQERCGKQSDPTSSDRMFPDASMEEGLSGEVAKISVEDTNGNLEMIFGNTLIGYNGEEGRFETNLIKEPKEFTRCKTTVLKDGFFAFEFPGSDECRKVLEHGQVFIEEDKPLILKRWSPVLEFERSRFLSSLPIWVRIYNINWANWKDEYLSRVCRTIGEFLFMDKSTATFKRLEYARVCVDIDPDKELPDIIHVLEHDDDDKTISFPVIYEWKPQICKHCPSLRHHSTSCRPVGEVIYLHREDSYMSIEDLKSSGIGGDEEGGGRDIGNVGFRGDPKFVPESSGQDGELVPESVTNQANWLERILTYFYQSRPSLRNHRTIERSVTL